MITAMCSYTERWLVYRNNGLFVSALSDVLHSQIDQLRIIVVFKRQPTVR